jgi:hypothetical protein
MRFFFAYFQRFAKSPTQHRYTSCKSAALEGNFNEKVKPFLQGHKKTSRMGRFEKVNHYIISEIKVFAITTQAACFSFFLFT